MASNTLPQSLKTPASERREWRTGSWADLVSFIESPNPATASNAAAFAFRRTTGLTGLLATSTATSTGYESAIYEALELDACIMREAFDVIEKAYREATAGRDRRAAKGGAR